MPSNSALTAKYCNPRKFSGILVCDGTYVKVRNYEKKIPFIWGVDYLTHDFPVSMLAPSENFISCLGFFSKLKNVGYDLKCLVCDGNPAISNAAEYVFPKVITQTCLKHYLKNISDDLNIKSSKKYRKFFKFIHHVLYEITPNQQHIAHKIAANYDRFKDDEKQYYWMTKIMRDRQILTNYTRVDNAPRTTNIIECFNGHLKDRLRSIRGFKSFHSAKYWLNAYVIKRRFTKFKACGKKFKHLNGFSPLELTAKIPKICRTSFKVHPPSSEQYRGPFWPFWC